MLPARRGAVRLGAAPPRAAVDARGRHARRLGHGDRRLGGAAASQRVAKAVLTADGKLTVSSATADIGTGTYTIMTQIAAETLGLPLEDVTFTARRFVPAAGAGRGRVVDGGHGRLGGQGRLRQGARTSCSQLARQVDDSPLADAAARRRDVRRRAHPIEPRPVPGRLPHRGDAARQGSTPSRKKRPPGRTPKQRQYSRYTHSAVFAEVKVDEDFGTVQRHAGGQRGRRRPHPEPEDGAEPGPGRHRLGHRHGAGRGERDRPAFGRFMNHNLAEYHVPVNADVHDIEVIFVEEHDDDRQPARRQRAGRDRHRRRGGGHRQRRLPRDRQARPGLADHARQVAVTMNGSVARNQGVNILERGSQVHFMAEFQELLDFPPPPTAPSRPLPGAASKTPEPTSTMAGCQRWKTRSSFSI